MKNLALQMLLAVLFFSASAQKILVEKTYRPDSKANLNNLSEVQIDKSSNEMRLFFITKSTEKRMKADLLYFDLDFNFLKDEKIEEEYEKMKTTYKLSWDICPEDKQPLLTVEANLTGQAVFKKGYIWNYYNWNTGWCEDKFKVEDKVKPKGEAGEKIKLVLWWSDRDVMKYQRTGTVPAGRGYVARAQVGRVRDLVDDKGNVVFLGLVYDKKDLKNNGKNYIIQKYDASLLEKIAENELNFDKIAIPLVNQTLYNGNVGILFRLQGGGYEYVEININASVEKRFSFSSSDMAFWKVIGMSEFGNDVYVYGTVYDKVQVKDSYFGTITYSPYAFRSSNLSGGKGKVSAIQIMKIGPGGIEWLTKNPISDVVSKFSLPEGEKKSAKPYDGKLMKIADFYVSSKTGEIFVAGQSYTESKKGRKYETVYMFHFDNKGKVKGHYSMKLVEKNKIALAYPADQAMIESKDGNSIYWTVFEVAGIKDIRVLYYPRIGKININNTTVGKFVSIGNGNYFLDDKFAVNALGDNQFIFIGSGRKSKDMWFCKVEFE